MKRKFNVDLVSAQVAFNAQEARYQTDFRAANERAQEAQNGIDSARLKKIASITLLAVSIIAAVGVVAATVVTGTLPLLLIGVPFALAAIPTGYYSFLFSKTVFQTIGRREAEINSWYQTTSDTIQRAFREAQQNLEEQYIAAKAAAR